MDAYVLGRDIQSLHEKIDRLSAEKCACTHSSGAGTVDETYVRIPRFTLQQVLAQHNLLAKIARGEESFERFVSTFGPKIGGKFS